MMWLECSDEILKIINGLLFDIDFGGVIFVIFDFSFNLICE